MITIEMDKQDIPEAVEHEELPVIWCKSDFVDSLEEEKSGEYR